MIYQEYWYRVNISRKSKKKGGINLVEVVIDDIKKYIEEIGLKQKYIARLITFFGFLGIVKG